MEHVNKKISQNLSQHKGVVSWFMTWYVHVIKKIKGSIPIPYMPSKVCEDGVQLWAMECMITFHDLGG
jgi:hypothetical protein